MQKSFKTSSQQRADMELTADDPANNGSGLAAHEAAADLLRQEGFGSDVPEEEEQVKDVTVATAPSALAGLGYFFLLSRCSSLLTCSLSLSLSFSVVALVCPTFIFLVD